MKPVPYHWDEMKIGPGAPPFKTTRAGCIFTMVSLKPWPVRCIAWAWPCTNWNDPSEVIGVSDQWILQPEDPWEVSGYVPNVVFTCGAVPEDDGTGKNILGRR